MSLSYFATCLIIFRKINKKINKMKNIIYVLGAALICAIFFTMNVGAVSSFPKSDASISAYVNVGQSIDLEKVKVIFNEVEKVGDNYIYGKTCIAEDTGGCMNVHVYADTDGWLVAYLGYNDHAANIMLWKTINLDNPAFTISTTLSQALTNAATEAQVSFSPTDVKYYDFKYPQANAMVILVKTQATGGSSIMQFQIPANYTLYEASYYHYIYYYSRCYNINWATNHVCRSGDSNNRESYWDSKMWVDATQVSDLSTYYGGNGVYSNVRTINSYGQYVQAGTLHKITISYEAIGSDSVESGSAGVATVLVYKKV